MKNYSVAILLLFSFSLLGQMTPLSSFQNKDLGVFRFDMFLLEGNEKHGNSLVTHAEGKVHLMLLDENFGLIKKKRLSFIPKLKNHFFYFQDEKYVYGIYERKRGKTPEIVRVDKENLKLKKQNLSGISKEEKVFSTFEEAGILYALTFKELGRDITVYKYSGFEQKQKIVFKNAGKHPLTYGKKRYEPSYRINRHFHEEASEKIFLEDNKLYFIRNVYANPVIRTETMTLDLSTQKSETASFTFEMNAELSKIKPSSFATNLQLNRYIASEIVGGKVFQCYRTEGKYLLNIFDYSSQQLIKTYTLDSGFFIREKLPTLSVFSPEVNSLLDITKSESLKVAGFLNNSKKVSLQYGSYTVIGIEETSEGTHVVLGTGNRVYQYGYGSHGNNAQWIGNSGSFTSFVFDKELNIQKDQDKRELNVIWKYLGEEHKKRKKSTKKKLGYALSDFYKDKVFLTNDGYRLISYTVRKRKFEIF